MTIKSAKLIYNELKSLAQNDPNIIGFFLGGSRVKGLDNKHSDYDIYIIVKNNKLAEYRKKIMPLKDDRIDIMLYTDKGLREHAAWGGTEEWARYNMAHIKVEIDKTKTIQKIINEKGKIPEDKVENFIRGNLDAYINYVYRSLKCLRAKNSLCAKLEASNSLLYFLNIIFALHGRRVKPFSKYLQWELDHYPLKKLPISNQEFLNILDKIISSADLNPQKKLFKITEKLFDRSPYKSVYNNWGEKIEWVEKFSLK
ncbi:hypothetical protein COT97_00780 [Candidatus Falkowbacteria bacterium CG10_big_fil_rev_8_21_14_0_10_39_11]|uniref:Polymerase beta nucleotidyltransferase domain-containing protein n=1 Tax=Candidatus Falkowbacteria bacterium CG10_big_fil_rev_8_21_14_0_10_39_11 TaxID=1974565 RepID=A0A2H0V857_9BACT|nr:MAG: hypothetical protein COT97_00780 [Candidatus Falkowbacteria bacterium CG10_big_fil_rev_8_21_14_0_10_39_11]